MDAAPPPVALLLTDLVGSAELAEQLGDEAMAGVWAAHDRLARDLLRRWRGHEIDKTDGFLLLFADAHDALGYVLAYHRALSTMAVPLAARAGLHVGQLTLRENPAEDVALGAKPFEADGVSKPLAARVMSTALGGQTLVTRAALDALQREPGALRHRVLAHGHWRVKGLPAPLELFEIGEDGAPFTPPPDAPKVYRVVRQGELWLPVRTLRHSLPAERDAFVGRRDTLQELARRFDEGARLVSLLGIGGTGKTRLATRFGWNWLGDFPGGVWFCDLAAARSVEGLYSAVAQGLQLPLGPADPLAQIGQAIAGRGECLVILDNFEQLARHAEATLGHWLDRAREACFLVTTREVLGIAGEETLAVAPLVAAEAAALFKRRAAAAQRDFAPGPEDEAAIQTLVKLLDGLPLAIELAAARVRALKPRALLARMSERFRLLASSGGRQDRQATLRATFDWSWELLPGAEKAALAQLSVFEGGFTLEAAEAVVDLAALPDPPWTLDVVNALVDKSFVRSLAGERFDLLVSVQAYADEHLRSEGRFTGSGAAALAAAQVRHGRWFAALGPQRATEQACADLDNLVVACRRAVAAGDGTAAAGALDGAWAALALHGPFQAAVGLAEAVLALPGLGARERALAARVLGHAHEVGGEREAALAQFESALAAAREAGDAAGEAAVLVRQAAVHARSGRAAEARTELALALQRARAAGDLALECAALNGLGTAEFEQGRFAAAQAQYEAALAVARRAGDARWLGNLQGNLANLHAHLGRLPEALAGCEEALDLARRMHDRLREGHQLCNLAMLLLLLGRAAEAHEPCCGAQALARELGHARLACSATGNRGLVLAALARLPEAQAQFEEALALARRLGLKGVEGYFLGHLGLTRARLGEAAAARAAFETGQVLLAEAHDAATAALLQALWAEAEAAAGHAAEAATHLAAARAGAAAVEAPARSELGQALARAEAAATRSG